MVIFCQGIIFSSVTTPCCIYLKLPSFQRIESCLYLPLDRPFTPAKEPKRSLSPPPFSPNQKRSTLRIWLPSFQGCPGSRDHPTGHPLGSLGKGLSWDFPSWAFGVGSPLVEVPGESRSGPTFDFHRAIFSFPQGLVTGSPVQGILAQQSLKATYYLPP